jgi:transposase
MEYGAIDLHQRKSLIRVVDADGRVLLDRTVLTSREGFRQVFEGRARLRVLLESGTDSEWVAQTIEACGHEVIVADPNYALMYGHRARHIKTDKRDVAALAEACRLGIYRPAHRVSATQRGVRRDVRIRAQLVGVRTQAINLLRAQLRQEGVRLPAGGAESTVARLARLEMPTALREALAPLRDVLTAVAPLIAAGDARVATHAATDPTVQRLMTVPGIGPITAVTYRATLDTVERFGDAGASTAFLGLVPREDSSGTRQRKGAITKAGPSPVRTLLVQAGWVVWRQRQGRGALHAWVERLAARRGRRIAIVALARRLARILYAIWRDATVYHAVPSVAAA